MKTAALAKLVHLLGVAKAAEAARLHGVQAEIADCRVQGGRLRREIFACRVPTPDGDHAPVAADLAAEMAAASFWALRLAERALASDARAAALETEAEAIRERLALAFGRESAASAMLGRARLAERRLAAQRAEAGPATRARAPDQAVSSGSDSDDVSAGSPGIV